MTKVLNTILLLFGIMFSLSSCKTFDRVDKRVRGNTDSPDRCMNEMVDYGNGVYYLPCSNVAFGKALSKFLAEHPQCIDFTMAGDGTGVASFDIGYFLACKKTQDHCPAEQKD